MKHAVNLYVGGDYAQQKCSCGWQGDRWNSPRHGFFFLEARIEKIEHLMEELANDRNNTVHKVNKDKP